ncbi:hypothetical protein [Nocardia mexicana]|uniref:Uncharacterized protein n=1 Tax=Nocardia mexicana TaxID=279262 RepID=A0A370HAE2_9NOCA|nr:hypothetical protein [Nocardia mexicana]RDI52994.1 hypothetical protein DFR68_103382 [Nocardia mexicana]
MTAAAIDRTPAASGVQPPGWAALGATLAGVLVFEGLLSLVLEVFYLPTYVGSTPLPFPILVAAVVNVLLVMGMGVVTNRPAAMALPLAAWLFGFLLCATTGPGGDVLLTDSWTAPVLLAGGLIPAGFYLFRRVFVRPRA